MKPKAGLKLRLLPVSAMHTSSCHEEEYLTRNFVTKANGTKQLFERRKVVKTCLRMGASEKMSRTVAKEVEKRVFNGIETSKILQMIFDELGKRNPSIKYRICLRKGISLMKPKPDFERFVQIILSEHGYDVTPNQIIQGKCIDHEIDAIARKNDQTYLVEIKHHRNYHTPTGLDESRIARAVFEDVTEGFKDGLNTLRIDRAMIVCNTKLSEHARRYAECRGIQKIGWSSPSDQNLQTLIEGKKLYPLSCLKDLDPKTREKLTAAGIILMKQLIMEDLETIARKTRIPKKKLISLVTKAELILT